MVLAMNAETTTMKHTTRKQDAAMLARLLADVRRPWTVGDDCRSYNNQSNTTIVAIINGIVTMANGDTCHVSKVRSAVPTVPASVVRQMMRGFNNRHED